MADIIVGEHFYLTLDEEAQDQVLELVRVDGEKMYTRQAGDWAEIDPEADDPRVWDRVIVDVTPEAATIFDDSQDTNDMSLSAFDGVTNPDEDNA